MSLLVNSSNYLLVWSKVKVKNYNNALLAITIWFEIIWFVSARNMQLSHWRTQRWIVGWVESNGVNISYTNTQYTYIYILHNIISTIEWGRWRPYTIKHCGSTMLPLGCACYSYYRYYYQVSWLWLCVICATNVHRYPAPPGRMWSRADTWC